VLDEQLVPLTLDTSHKVNDTLIAALAKLVQTTENPLRLFDAMDSLESLHHLLLTYPISSSKPRPSPFILEASQSYLALRTQLAMLDKGLTACVGMMVAVQTALWGAVRERWEELWNALRVEGEANGGAGEMWSAEVEGMRTLDIRAPPYAPGRVGSRA
jgi:dynamin-binding protein